MHKIALFISFISTNIQNVLISHYRMYGRFANTKVTCASANRRTRFNHIFGALSRPIFNLFPHKNSPLFRQKIPYIYVEKGRIST